VREYLLNAFATLFVTIEPIGLAPIFIALTSGMPESSRRRTAISASIIAAAVLVGFALFGGPVIEFLGISLPAFRIAGGLLLFWIAFEMIFDLRAERKAAAAQAGQQPGDAASMAAFPLAVPMMAGPAAIAATIITAEAAPSTAAFVLFIAILLGIIAMCLVVFLLATRFDMLLKRTGRIVLSRLFGVVLAALAVQFVADGVKAIVAA
jgi:multiple antibiotic resistance protein